LKWHNHGNPTEFSVSRLKLSIDSNLADVSLVAAAVSSACSYLGLDTVSASQVELCVVEAVTNAIQHAYHGQPGQVVSVVVSSELDLLHLEVIDNGTPMSANNLERLLQGTDVFQVHDIDRLAESGRGLQIIHDLMDGIAYSSEESVNRLHLTKRVNCSQPC
jgi:serine/threonine-protein kinase RsbW